MDADDWSPRPLIALMRFRYVSLYSKEFEMEGPLALASPKPKDALPSELLPERKDGWLYAWMLADRDRGPSFLCWTPCGEIVFEHLVNWIEPRLPFVAGLFGSAFARMAETINLPGETDAAGKW